MKILHIITGLGVGGAERALYGLLSSQQLNRSVACEVVSLTESGFYADRIRDLGVPVRSLVMNCRGSLSTIVALRHLRRLIRQSQPDVIHAWMYHACLATLSVSDLRIPILWGVRHSLHEIGREKRLTRLAIRACAHASRLPRAISYNSVVARRQHEEMGFFSERSTVIPNGFDLERWRPSVEVRRRTRTMLNIPDVSPIVGHFARFHPMKNHADYLRALVELTKKHPEAHFLLVGTGVQKDNPALRPLLASLPNERLHLLGERSDVEHLLPAIDALCLSSSWGEAFPNVLGEAMACGVPCVSTDVGDANDIMGNTGISVPSNDERELYKALNHLLNETPSERRVRGNRARKRIESKYGMEAVVERYLKLYADVARPGAGR